MKCVCFGGAWGCAHTFDQVHVKLGGAWPQYGLVPHRRGLCLCHCRHSLGYASGHLKLALSTPYTVLIPVLLPLPLSS